jgi:hypothetical protein
MIKELMINAPPTPNKKQSEQLSEKRRDKRSEKRDSNNAMHSSPDRLTPVIPQMALLQMALTQRRRSRLALAIERRSNVRGN